VKSLRCIAERNRLITAHNGEDSRLPRSKPDFTEVYVVYPLENMPEQLLEHEFIGIRTEQLNLVFNSLWKRLIHKMVALAPVTVRTQRDHNLHRILRAVDNNTLISKLTEADFCKPDEVLKPVSEICDAYRNYPQILANTEKILEDCHFSFDFSTPKNKKHFTATQAEDEELLRNLAYDGLKKR